MSTVKATTSPGAERDKRAELVTEEEHDLQSETVRDVEVISLEIDEDDDFGSDPYNSTGQHVLIELKDYEE